MAANSRPRKTRLPLKTAGNRKQRLRPTAIRRKKTLSRRRSIRNKRKNVAGSAVKGAQSRLKNFRQASVLAVALTGFIMLIFSPGEAGLAQGTDTVPEDSVETVSDTATTTDTIISTKEATTEAFSALQNLWDGFFYNLPKLLIAIGTFLLAWAVVWLLRKVLKKVIGKWDSSGAVISLVSIAVWLLAIGIALSVMAGDIRALVGSLGLIGLALSWSLQTPIESFTGWLMNSFKGYYRVGDRIMVGDVFGDVYRIDFLTTTVWEIGSPYQAGFVNAEQPTGRMVTFPNNEVLSGSVTNLTGDFPFVWDELAVSVANESDIPLALKVLQKTADEFLGTYMVEPSRQYSDLLRKAGLDFNISDKPEIFLSLDDSWTNLTIRYLVGARERRKWKSELIVRTNQELAKPEYLNKIIPVYARQQLQFIDSSGVPVAPEFPAKK